jgi:predicted AlkP superfamily phosphohydrolase/phosphomutase
MAARLLLLGLDGVGHDLLSRLSEEGVTPNLAALAREGASGPLRSTVPPITGPSWLAIASGLEPDQTGVPDFLIRRGPLFEMRPISARDFRGRALWEPIGAAGGRVAVFNFPVLYPPYPVNGVMVSGFGTDEATQWTYPEELKRELLEAVGSAYSLTVNYHNEVYADAHRFLDDLEVSLAAKLRAAEVLCRREPWDLFFCVLSETDWLLHRCWADLDPEHPLHDPRRSPAVADRLRTVFATVDAAVPRLVEALGDGASLLVCSDHGFGGNTRTVKLNLLLEREGLLVRRPASERRGASLGRTARRAAERAGVVAARARGPLGKALSIARRRARRLLPRDDSAYLSSVVDYDASVAFDPGHTIPFGGLYVMPRLERGEGSYLEALARVESALVERAERAGVRLEARRMWLDAEGRHETLPDLVVSGDEWATTFVKADFEGEPFLDAPFSPRHTGSHRIDGVLVAAGPAFRAAGALRASAVDVAPTVLALFGLEAPPDRRGRALDELLAGHGPLAPAPRPELSDAPEATDDDEADVRERLRGLGYIE